MSPISGDDKMFDFSPYLSYYTSTVMNCVHKKAITHKLEFESILNCMNRVKFILGNWARRNRPSPLEILRAYSDTQDSRIFLKFCYVE